MTQLTKSSRDFDWLVVVKSKTPVRHVIIWWVAGLCVLCPVAFWLGYYSTTDTPKINKVPVLDATIIGQRGNGQYLMVRRDSDSMTGFIRCGSPLDSCPAFEVGTKIQLELWEDKYNDRIFIYRRTSDGGETEYWQEYTRDDNRF